MLVTKNDIAGATCGTSCAAAGVTASNAVTMKGWTMRTSG
jgi:hypothetical protein